MSNSNWDWQPWITWWELHQWKHIGDLVAAIVAGATVADYLPPIAAILTIIYTALRIWETATVQRWVNRGKDKTSHTDLS